MKNNLKETAVKLRLDGKTYSEILKEVPVAKSTLSLWLKSVALSKKQAQKLTARKLRAVHRGGEAKRKQRLIRTENIYKLASKEVDKIIIDKDKLWLMGVMLYWAEGDKDKEYAPGKGIGFSNSDPFMVKIFLKWLRECLNIPDERLTIRIYIHENSWNRIQEVANFWSSHTGIAKENFAKVCYKRHKINSSRKNKGTRYYGLVKINVRKSSDLNRKIAGWIFAISNHCGVV